MALARIVDKNGNQATVLEESLVTADPAYYAGHDHRLHVVSKLWEGVANAGNCIMWGRVPRTIEHLHTYIQVNGEGAWHLRVYVSPRVTAGTREQLLDTSRCQPIDNPAAVYTDGTVTSYGKRVFEKLVGGGLNSLSGGSAELESWFFCRGQRFLVRMTNASGGAADCSIVILGQQPV